MQALQAFKSKTIDLNILATAIISALPAFGITLPPQAIVGIMALMNIILRFFTKKPLAEK